MSNSFHNPSLNDAIGESRSVFDSFIPTINQISQDIKDLEIYLKSKGLHIEYEMKIHEYFVDDVDINPDYDSSVMYLKWGKFNDQGLRLLLLETKENEHDKIYKVVSEKPLIECTLEDRANAYNCLDAFVRNLCAEIESTFEGYSVISDDE